MGLVKPSEVIFAEDKTEKEFNQLDENDEVKKGIRRAIEDLKLNAFYGTPIPKKLIPKIYLQKYNVKNLWKYDLPNAWRLIYTIEGDKITVLSVILEWFNHKDYEKRFRY